MPSHLHYPVCQAINRPLLMCGLERQVFMFFLIITVSFYWLTNELLITLILAAGVYVALRAATAKDVNALFVAGKASRMRAIYDPGKYVHGDRWS